MTIFGIDVGFSGAIAVIKHNSFVIEVYSMPTLNTGSKRELNTSAIKNLLSSYPHPKVFIEKAQAMPKQGVSSMFRYGETYGLLKGICIGLNIPYEIVRPQEWKKDMLKGMEKGKEAAIVKVQQIFPEVVLKKNHNKAEAILIALWGLRHENFSR
jgi:crossover junction endodeoxyribonuclease RuvC